ncbi:MAG: glycosyltransferase [Methanobrevibacter sp.]|nr:glycosyltransferase [Candidatus Methanovirga meridionalis]
MFDVCLISNMFSRKGTGVGVYSEILYDGLKNHESLNVSKVELGNSDFFKYLFNSKIKLHFDIPDAKIYHALTPPFIHTGYKDKTIVTVHDLLEIQNSSLSPFMNNKKGRIIEPFCKFFDRRAVLKCKHIITSSEETKDKLNSLYNVNLDKISVIRMGFTDNLSYRNKDDDTYNIGTLSSLIKRKRIDILIKSFLKADIENSRLFIGGEGSEEYYLRKIADGDDRIKFLGFISDEELNDFYNNLDVFVFPTAYEGYGFPMIEAMKCEKPVVTLDNAHLLSDVRNRTHISSINELSNDLKNKVFDCDIKSNLEFAKEHSIKIMVEETKKIYGEF